MNRVDKPEGVLGEIQLAVVTDTVVSLGDALRLARWEQNLSIIDRAVDRHVILSEAEASGIRVDKADVQAAADAFRNEHKLFEASTTRQWLAKRGLTATDWQRLLREDLTIERFAQVRFGTEVAGFFAAHRLEYHEAVLSWIVVNDLGVARELVLQIQEGESAFADLAREFSVDGESAGAGGFLGRGPVSLLPAAAQARVTGAHRGDIVGPLALGRRWSIYRVEAQYPPQLDERTRQRIVRRLLAEWVAERRQDKKIWTIGEGDRPQ